MYQLGHPVLKEALGAALSGRTPVTTELAKTVRITRWVKRRIRNGAGMPPMAPAVAAIQARRGDCTEFAAAVVGLLRNAGIPARMAMGLVYDNVGFQFHAWAEAHIDDRWVPVDAAYKRVGLPPIYVLLGYGDSGSALYENRAFRLLSGFRFRFLPDAPDG
jgi:transglutaminase-like putative cysteine protease